MAGELGISTSAYSKIERGVTDPSVGRVAEIAKILDTDIIYFFQGEKTTNKIDDGNKSYGFASKSDIEELTNIIKQLKQEIDNLKKSIETPTSKKKKKV